MGFEVSNSYIENISTTEFSFKIDSEIALEACLTGSDGLAFFLQSFDEWPLLLKKKHSFSINGQDFGLCRLSHLKHFALWFLEKVFYSLFETASFGCLNSFWMAATYFIADSRDSKMSLAFL